MALTTKTTILFSAELHRRLTDYAARRGVSLGELVREACEITYGLAGSEERASAVHALGKLKLPVGTPASMKRESQPDPDDLLP